MAKRLFDVPDPYHSEWAETQRDVDYVNMPADIVNFHEKFGLAYDGPPRELNEELMQFRIDFMQEELNEYIEGAVEGNHEKMIDALADLVYVALGTAYLHGYPIAEAWRRIQIANMSKVRAERADQSKRGTTYDVVKPEGWTPPDHSDLVIIAIENISPGAAEGLWPTYRESVVDNMDEPIEHPAQCPVCRHAWHGTGRCYNMASDNDCECKGVRS